MTKPAPKKRNPIPEISLFLVIMVLGMLFIRYTWKRIGNEQSKNVLQIARSIEATLSISELNALEAKTTDIDKPQYRHIKNTLKAIIRVNSQARFAYLYTEKNGKLYIIADSESEDSKDYSPPGQEYTEATPQYKQPFWDGKELITTAITDRWGTWRSVFIPIKDAATGKTIAVFAMDYNSKSWNNYFLLEVAQSSVLMLLLLLAFVFSVKIKARNKSLNNIIGEHKQTEVALLVSENKKAAILKAIPDLLFVFNQNGDYLEIFTEDDSKLFLTREALIGKNISDLFPPDIAVNAKTAFAQSLQTKKLVQFFYTTYVNAKTEYFEARIVPASGSTVLTIVRDITERKLAEEAVFQSQERARAQRNAIARIAEDEAISSDGFTGSFKKLMEEIALAIQVERASIWLFSEDKTVLQCIALFENETKRHSSGATLQSVDYPRYFEAIKHESRISANDAQNDPRTNEFTKGYLVPLGIYSMLDAGIYAEGELIGVVCFEHTAQKRTWHSDEESFASTIASIVAQTLANSERKHAERILHAIISENPISIQIVDKEGFTLQVNAAHTALFGAVPPASYSVFDDVQLAQQGLGKLIERAKNGEVVHFPDFYYNIHDFDTELSDVPLWIQAVIFPLNDNSGKPERFVLMHENITVRKQAEDEIKQALEKAESGNRLKEAFVHNISHEIRTPLNGILGFSNLIALPDITDDDRQQFYSHLKTSSNRLLDTITNYMDISLIGSGNMVALPTAFDPLYVFHQLLEKYSAMCSAKNIGLRLEIPEGTKSIMLHTDEGLLRKAMMHLLDNAVKFTAEGEIVFGYVSTGSTTETGSISKPGNELDELRLFVKDTGIGINPESFSLIFESFKQEDFSRSRGFEGSGLGLSIAQGFVLLLGSQILLESVKGSGSVFFFTLPYQASAAGISPQGKANTLKLVDKPVILVAEDNASNLLYLEITLTNMLISVISARDGKEAVDLCRHHPEISLVLMDIKMPVMDGLQATREIKSFRKDLPIIACSAFALSEDIKMAFEAGCTDHLAKPVNDDNLLEKLKKYGLIV